MPLKDLALAFRNLFRHRVRSAIALSAIVFGVAALLQSGGFIEWIFLNLRETTIKSRLGHIQVTRPNYFTDGTADPFAFLLSGQAGELERIRATAGVQVVTPRLSFGGLLSHGDVTVSFLGEGVDPEKETAVSGLLSITAGKNLSASDPQGVILGEGLAATVGARPGDQVVLLAATASGGMNAVEVRVLGLFATYTKAFDDVALRLPIATAEGLLRVDGAHTWVVLLDKTERTPEVLRQFRARFPEASSRLAFRPWSEMADFYNKTVKLFSRQMGVVDLIIALIIVLSISNTLTKSVLERTGEIGTLMATGSQSRRILRLFLFEGLFLGLVGGILGVLIGLGVAHLISSVGIPMPPPPGSNRSYRAEILVTIPLAARAFSIALGTALLASLHPAWRASRLKIVDALRHNR
jgi:putative ABC transport system permease protein